VHEKRGFCLDRERPEVIVGDEALQSLYRFCEHNAFRMFLLVADTNTFAVLGEAVEKELRKRRWEVTTVVLQDKEVLADSRTILRVLLAYDTLARTFLAVGSGTITDITRLVSHRTGNRFISIPTAPSVDGYASTNVPLIVDGIKKSFTTRAPAAIFADTTTLSSAPKRMIAAGFGDMLGKYTSIADWRLGHLINDQPYDESIARRALDAVRSCTDSVQAIGGAVPTGIAKLMEALIESGLCMADFGSSVLASGTEHHYSHCWEMKLLMEGRPPILHGAKVGVATILVARLYEKLRQLSRNDALDLLRDSIAPLPEDEASKIRAAFGPMAGVIIRDQPVFFDFHENGFERFKQRIVESWSDIQAIAAEVPSAERIIELLTLAGGPTSPEELGLSAEDLALATSSAHYLRRHFTVRRLMELLYPGSGGKPPLSTSTVPDLQGQR
jgi:glycerol-1-phosphate dehydrogenase [NAD(P)+]